jgi:PEP-CTERM motif
MRKMLLGGLLLGFCLSFAGVAKADVIRYDKISEGDTLEDAGDCGCTITIFAGTGGSAGKWESDISGSSFKFFDFGTLGDSEKEVEDERGETCSVGKVPEPSSLLLLAAGFLGLLALSGRKLLTA